jgi:hypothetical protein
LLEHSRAEKQTITSHESWNGDPSTFGQGSPAYSLPIGQSDMYFFR